ncbi:hypothetical protein B296_00042277 [Ensete ventricosum]|uniref:Secreted protein n=1 Tax=Ensete ventricosum TaxID=4639 RepID=A0A426YUB7_ENSVE|nr:hypothetical protein B296_00042277 [Ensete ventricosum]
MKLWHFFSVASLLLRCCSVVASSPLRCYDALVALPLGRHDAIASLKRCHYCHYFLGIIALLLFFFLLPFSFFLLCSSIGPSSSTSFSSSSKHWYASTYRVSVHQYGVACVVSPVGRHTGSNRVAPVPRLNSAFHDRDNDIVAWYNPGARPKRPTPGLGRAPRQHLFEARRLEIKRGA